MRWTITIDVPEEAVADGFTIWEDELAHITEDVPDATITIVPPPVEEFAKAFSMTVEEYLEMTRPK